MREPKLLYGFHHPREIQIGVRPMRLGWMKTVGTVSAVLVVSLVWKKLGMPDRTGNSAIMAEEIKKVLLYAVPTMMATKAAADSFDSGIYRWLDDGGPALSS